MKEPILYRIVRGPLTVLFKAVYRPTVTGKEIIPKDGRIILAGNHTHIFDCLLIASTTKRCVHYLAKDELMKPPLNHIFKRVGIIPVNRRQKDKAALDSAIAVLRDDKVIGIFPEGTVNRTDSVIMPFKFGAVKMAYETDSKIVPFVISGKYKPFRKSVKVTFFDAVQVSENLEEANNKLMKIVYDELVKEGEKNEKT